MPIAKGMRFFLTIVGLCVICLGLVFPFLLPDFYIIARRQSAKEDSFFRQIMDSPTYVHFRTNGTYSKITKGHGYAGETDRGTWTQDPSGWITMRSEMRYRNVEAGPLEVFTWSANVAAKLEQTHAAIASLLRTNSSKYFDAQFVGQHLVQLPSWGTNFDSPITVDYRVKQVSRKELSALLRAIEAFPNSVDKCDFHVAPMRYGNTTFLLWRESRGRMKETLTDITCIIRVRARVKGRAEDSPFHYFAIDRKTFEEANRTQGFMFHPEMNKLQKDQAEGGP